ncbi:MAG: RNA methyltransferase [Burkholderiaceae bacterium]
MDPESAWQYGRSAIDFVLVHTSHPGNVGAAARAISVMGFNRLVLVRPFVDRANEHREATALASGARDVLANCRIVDTLAQAIGDSQFAVGVSAEGREFSQKPQSPEAIAGQISSCIAEFSAADEPADNIRNDLIADKPAPIALVFGTERDGLRLSEAQQCQAMCTIASNPAYGSLNLAQAVQVIAYVVRQALLIERPPAPPVEKARHHRDLPAPNQQLDSMLNHLETVLVGIDFLDPAQPKRLMQRLRHLFTRANLSITEVDILRGIFNQVEALRSQQALQSQRRQSRQPKTADGNPTTISNDDD